MRTLFAVLVLGTALSLAPARAADDELTEALPDDTPACDRNVASGDVHATGRQEIDRGPASSARGGSDIDRGPGPGYGGSDRGFSEGGGGRGNSEP